MPRGYGNYSLVVGGSNFNPFQSMQEMLVPFTYYKDAYEKQEALLDELNKNTDTFKYLEQVAKDNPESKAAQIYNTYANDLRKYGEDFSANGLSMANRRGLLNMKRRYQGEIGRLVNADEAMREVKKNRDKLRDSGVNMLYTEDNLNIDRFLDNNTPNLYGINPEELRKEGALYAQAATSRIYGNTQINNINKYFQEIAQTQGYSPEVLAAWRQNLESIPEFNQAVEDIMEARQVKGNLTGRNYEIARQNIINGIMEGSMYQEKRSIQQNPGVLTAAQAVADSRAREQMELSALQSGYVKKNGKWTFDTEAYKERMKAIGEANLSNPGSYNPDEWEYGPDGKWHRKPKSSTPKQPKPTLRENTYYDEEGNTGPVKESQVGNSGYGKEITYEDALSKYPDKVANHHPGYERYYHYYEGTLKGGKKVLNIIKDPSKLNTVEAPDSIEDEGDDDA